MAPKTTRSDWEFEVRRLRSQPLRIEDMLWTPEVRPLLSQPKNLSDLFEHFKTKGMLKGTIGTVDQLCERICTAVYLAQYDYIYARESQLWQRHLKKAASGVLKQQKRAFDVFESLKTQATPDEKKGSALVSFDVRGDRELNLNRIASLKKQIGAQINEMQELIHECKNSRQKKLKTYFVYRLASVYVELTGRSPSRTTDQMNKQTGPFWSFCDVICRLLYPYINKKSVDYSARKAADKWGRQHPHSLDIRPRKHDIILRNRLGR